MKSSLSFIFVTVFLDAIGIGLVIPIMPSILKGFVEGPDRVSQYFGFFISVYAAMQFLASPVLGAVSDRFGRRPILLLSLIGAGIDYLVMAFAPNLLSLCIGRGVSGLTGANITVATSSVADTSDAGNRAQRFGLVNAAFGVGFILGPALGGFLGEISPKWPFLAAAGMNLLNFAFGLFVLPESLRPENRRPMQWGHLNPFRSLRWVFTEKALLPLATVVFLFDLAGQIPNSIWAIYLEQRFAVSAKGIGLSFSAYGLLFAAAQGVFTSRIIRGLGEERTFLYGLFLHIVCFIGFGFSGDVWVLHAMLLPLCLASVSGPAMQSLLSGRVAPNKQGELQGTMVSLMSLAAIIGPLLTTNIYAAFNSPERSAVFFPGAPFMLGALLCLVGLLIAWLHLRRPAA